MLSVPASPAVGQDSPSGVKPAIVHQFKVEDTDFAFMAVHLQRFTKQCWGRACEIHRMFEMPKTLPWKHVIPVFDPGFTNRQAIDWCLSTQQIAHVNEFDLGKFTGAEASEKPRLFIMENSVVPTPDTMGKSANELSASGRKFADMCTYVIGFGLRYFVQKDYVDQRTRTLFPDNRVGRERWPLSATWMQMAPVGPKLYLETVAPDGTDEFPEYSGAREVVEVPFMV